MSERKRWQRLVDYGIAASIVVQVVMLACVDWSAGFIGAGVAFNGYMLARPWGRT